MRLNLTSTSSIPNSGVILAALSRMIFEIPPRPALTFAMASAAPIPSRSSVTWNVRFVERTISIRSKEAMAFRVSPSTMSSRRLCPPRSSRTAWKNRSGSAMRQRAYVSTQMYFLSLVGISFGSPSACSPTRRGGRAPPPPPRRCRAPARLHFLPLALELEEREDASRALVENQLSTHLRQDRAQRFEVDAPPGHAGRLPVLLLQGLEALGVPFGVVDALERVALGRADGLFGLSLGLRNRLVVLGPGVVDGALLLLDGLVDLVERRLHQAGRIHVLEDELLDLDADPVQLTKPLQLRLGLKRDRLAPDGQDLVHAVIAHDLAHGRLGHVPERLGDIAHAKEVCRRILDPVLDDPLDHRDVEVSRANLRFGDGLLRGRRISRLGRRPRGPEPELHLELPLDRHLGDLLHAEGDLDVRARLGGPHELAEALDHRHLVRFDLVVAGHDQEQGRRNAQDEERPASRDSRERWHLRHRRELEPLSATQIHAPSTILHVRFLSASLGQRGFGAIYTRHHASSSCRHESIFLSSTVMRKLVLHEVGPRDGLQVEKQTVPTGTKLAWIGRILASGVDIVQVGSFVHPEKVPQMADTDELFRRLSARPDAGSGVLSGLVLNEKGLDRALSCGCLFYTSPSPR